MKKKLLLLIGVILLTVLAVGGAAAQSPGGLSYLSGVQVYNLDAGLATIGLTYYNQDGTVAESVPDTIPGNSSKTYFPVDADVGFNGSLVVSSDKPITAIANTHAIEGTIGAASTSFSSGANEINLPLIMCNNAGYNTWFNVQNAGASDASVTIEYKAGLFGSDDSEVFSPLKPGAAHTFDQEAGSATVNCDTLAGSDTKFVGSAVITSDQPVVATVMELNSPEPHLLGYNGFTSGSTTVSLPLIQANNPTSAGFWTGVQVQNVDGGTANVTIEYSDNLVGTFDPVDESFSLASGSSKTILQAGSPPGNGSANNWIGQRYVGSATVTSDQELVVIVNQTLPKNNQEGPYGTAYEGFNPDAATGNMVLPLLMSNNPTSAGFFTSVQVQNVGDASCPNINFDYSPNVASGGNFEPEDEDIANLAAGSSATVFQAGSPPDNGSTNDWIGKKYVGSAFVSAPGCQIVAIVNELVPLEGDGLYTYIGYTVP